MKRFGGVTLLGGGVRSEAHLSTQPHQAKTHPRISPADEEHGGPASLEPPAGQGEKAADGDLR